MWLFIAMILIMPFEKNPYLYLGSSFLGILPDFTVIKLLGLLGLGWAMLSVGVGRVRIRPFQSRQAIWFFGFVFCVITTTLLNGADLLHISRLISVISLLPFALAAMNDEHKLRAAVTAAALSLVLVFPYAYRQMERFGGRMGVGLYEPNYFAVALVLIAPLSFVLATHAQGQWRRRVWLLSSIVYLLAIVLTGSRGGFVGLVVVALLVVIRMTRRRSVGLLTSFAAVCLVVFLVPNPLLPRLKASRNSGADTGVEQSNRARLDEIIAGVRMIRERPLTGVGMGNYQQWMEGYEDIETSAMAHNTYLQIGAELGLPALVVFVSIFAASYRSLARSSTLASASGRPDLRDTAKALQIGLMGYLASALFLSAHFEKYLWLIVFMSIALERVVRVAHRSALSVEPQLPRHRHFVGATVS